MDKITKKDLYILRGGGEHAPDTIIIHAMSEIILYNGTEIEAAYFLREIGLSAHALIKPSGEILLTRVTKHKAYHARGFNKNTLGIEFLMPGLNRYNEFINKLETKWWADIQIKAGCELISGWCILHDIKKIVGHCDVDPVRKYDPGKLFPMDDLRKCLGSS